LAPATGATAGVLGIVSKPSSFLAGSSYSEPRFVSQTSVATNSTYARTGDPDLLSSDVNDMIRSPQNAVDGREATWLL
jgi:hypothetical protein